MISSKAVWGQSTSRRLTRPGDQSICVSLTPWEKDVWTCLHSWAHARQFQSRSLREKLIASQLVGIKPSDPWPTLSAVLLLAIVTAIAATPPAWRAAKSDPMEALRYGNQSAEAVIRIRRDLVWWRCCPAQTCANEEFCELSVAAIVFQSEDANG